MPLRLSQQQRILYFWSRVTIADLLGCWNWEGPRDNFGYGRTTGFNGGSVLTHRFAWIIVYGSIPHGLWVLHKCHTPPCCNPNHLYLGTHKDNMRDAVERGSFHFVSVPGENHPNAKLTKADVLQIRCLLKENKLTSKAIAARFGVAASTVRGIKSRRKWAHIP